MKIPNKKPWIPKGFTLVSHQEVDADLNNIRLYLSEEQKNGCVGGEKLLQEVQDKRPLNSAHLRYLLDKPALIPDTWKSTYVYFWGTILQLPRGDRYVLCLNRVAGEWDWYSYWLDDGWDARGPSAVSAICTQLSESQHSSDTLPLELVINNVTYVRRED